MNEVDMDELAELVENDPGNERRTPADEHRKNLRSIFDTAAANGEKPKQADIIDSVVNALLEDIASIGSEVLYTEQAWWLFDGSKGYWQEIEQLLLQQRFQKLWLAITNGVPTIKLVNEVMSALRDRVYKPEVQWNDDTSIVFFANGKIIDMNTGKDAVLDAASYVRKQNVVRVAWEPSAVCPVWDKAINEVMAHIPAADRAGAIALIEEHMGLSFFPGPRPRAINKALMIWGPPHTGKSTILHTLLMIWGDNNATTASAVELGRTFGMQSFIGKRLWLCDETPDTETLYGEMFKRLITQQEITINRKNRTAVSVTPRITVTMAGNDLPEFGNNPQAIHDRCLFVNFDTRIKEDPTFLDRLENEAAGVVQKLWRAGQRLMQRGYFDIPQSILDTHKGVQDSTDPMGEFFRTALNAGASAAGGFIKSADIVSAYKGYMQGLYGDDPHRRYPAATLCRRVQTFFPMATPARRNSGTQRVWFNLNFTKAGLAWLDMGWKVEDQNYKTDPKRLADANGTVAPVSAIQGAKKGGD